MEMGMGLQSGWDIGQAYNENRRRENQTGEFAERFSPYPDWYDQELGHTYQDTNQMMTDFVHAMRMAGDPASGDGQQYLDDYLSRNPLYQGVDIEQQANFRSGKQGIEDQYGVAKEQILSQLPAGGVMQSELGGLASDRAEGISDLNLQNELMSSRYKKDFLANMWDKAYGATYGAPAAALGTGASRDATSLQYQTIAEQNQNNRAKQEGLGDMYTQNQQGKSTGPSGSTGSGPALVVSS